MSKKSSKQWYAAHVRDPYVKRAQQEGLRARSAFKLEEIQNKYAMLQRGHTVLDLGAAPGAWSALAHRCVMPKGKVVAVDRLVIPPLAGVVLIQGDVLEEDCQKRIRSEIPEGGVDVVLCDLAPNWTGIRARDLEGVLELLEVCIQMNVLFLKRGGSTLIKIFQDPEVFAQLMPFQKNFSRFKMCKPSASRGRSSEQYFLGQGFGLSAKPTGF